MTTLYTRIIYQFSMVHIMEYNGRTYGRFMRKIQFTFI